MVMLEQSHETDNFKRLLLKEAKYQLPEEAMVLFISKMKPMHCTRGDIIVESGEVNPDIYIVKEGICAYTYMNGTDLHCHAFAMAGSVIMSSLSYYNNEPSYFQIESCCNSLIMKITREDFNSLIETSHQFAIWVSSMNHQTLYLQEYKLQAINGSAIEKYKSLIKIRPEIIRNVSNKLIASYLGITQQYLSMLKRRLYTP